MNPNSKNLVSGDLLSKKPTRKGAVSSAAPMKPFAASMKPSAAPMKPIGQSGVSGDSSSKKRNGKAVVCSDVPSDKNDGVVFFKNVTFGPQADELRFRLIHFWEARNTLSKILIGLEMLLIDEEGTVIQGFIPPSRIDTYLRHMIPGSTYRLNNFFGSKTKKVYRVADRDVTIAFSWNPVLYVLKDSSIRFPEDRFRFHGYELFEAACDLRGDLYDYIGHIRLVNEQTLNESLVLDEVEISSMRRILVHVQTHDGPVMKLYIWDKAATDFCEKFKSLGKLPSVILVTTVNPKRFGGALSLSSLSSSQVAWFEYTTTIDDVVRDSAWYYIACGGCKTKATKGPTTLMCKKCGKAEITGAADFVVLGDAGHELTGKKASGLVESYYEANEGAVDGHVVLVPQALINTIGQTRTFVIKISNHNLEGKTQALTVTKVFPLEVPVLGCDLDDIVVVPPTGVSLETGNREEGSSIVNEEHAVDGVKRGSDMIVSDDAKRAKCG
ncbi:BnaC05g10800D [Brassica napus]|uniref:BnaC05g10800D protein n=1 Tax=Brassica napus TaxID=3708 RepID=A0A078HUR6_BRANA|nr:BnaC05g10800D [Brassica napus]